jgi:hypothetical protein
MPPEMEAYELQSLLIDSIHTGDVTSAKRILENGADADGGCGEISQLIPLHEATGCEDAELVRLLLQHGADLAKPAATGATALHIAALCGNTAATKLLLDSGAKVNDQDNAGRTALHEAAQRGYMAVVRLLLERQASPTVRDTDSTTPADLAFDHGHFRVFQLLLETGGRLNKKSHRFTRACSLAVWTRNHSLASLIGQSEASCQYIRAKAKPLEPLLHTIEKSMTDCRSAEPQTCSKCTEFLTRPASTWERGYAGKTPEFKDALYNHLIVTETRASAEQGCVFCGMILDSLLSLSTVTTGIASKRTTTIWNRDHTSQIRDNEGTKLLDIMQRGEARDESGVIEGSGVIGKAGVDGDSTNWTCSTKGVDGIYGGEGRVGDEKLHERVTSGDGLENLDSGESIQLTYMAYSKRYLMASTQQLWSDFHDKIEVRCGDTLGYIRIASIEGEIINKFIPIYR